MLVARRRVAVLLEGELVLLQPHVRGHLLLGAGEGEGGGLYLEPGGLACADMLTVIAGNHASTSDDDVFGTLGSC